MKNNGAYKNILRNFNAIIGISFILIISVVYIAFIFSIDLRDLSFAYNGNFENIICERILYYLKIVFSFLIPFGFFIFIFLFALNPISIKSILISFILIFLISLYIYKLPFDILFILFDDIFSKDFAKLIIKLIFANLLILFAAGLSYIKFDIKKLNLLYDFYTMTAEIIIWTFLIFFIIAVIFLGIFSIFYFFYFNKELRINRIIIFLIRNNAFNLKIFLSIFAILKTSIIYFSFLIYKKMKNTKLSINLSRTLTAFASVFLLIILNKNFDSKIFLYIFLILFVLIIFFFRADKNLKKHEYIIYIISNFIGIIFSIFIICKYKNYITEIFYIFLTAILINFIYNIFAVILKKNYFLFYYNCLYAILFIIFLFI